jgi:hypothetical protein
MLFMNEAFAPPPPRPTTRAAEGLPRWRWTVAEIETIAMAGYFHDEERFELLGGEIVPIRQRDVVTRSSEENSHSVLRA